MSGLIPHVVETLASRTVERLHDREPGHCLQIAHVPVEIADRACQRVNRELAAPDRAWMVMSSPVKDWHATPAKIVEARNAAEESGGRLAVFVPAGRHVAAEDSFGRSTFEVLEVADIYDRLVDRLHRDLQVVAPDLAERVDTILAAARNQDTLDQRDIACYLARLLDKPSEDEAGRALVELGLLPDSDIARDGDDQLAARLQRNRQQMTALTDLAPPADRVQDLGLDPEAPGVERVNEVLLDALADGTTDSRELGRRLDAVERPPDFTMLVAPTQDRPTVQELSVLTLAGDFAKGSDPPTLKKANATVKVKYRCVPPAGALPGLKELRLSLVAISDQGAEQTSTGLEVLKRGNSLPNNKEGTWSMKLALADLDAGLYRLRLQAADDDNLVLAEAFSDTFKIHEDIEEEQPETYSVPSVSAARVEARCRAPEGRDPGQLVVGADPDADDTKALALTVRFDGVPGRSQVRLSRLLSRVERMTVEDPESLARFRVSLADHEIEKIIVPPRVSELPRRFLGARTALFQELRTEHVLHPVEGTAPGPLLALADLVGLETPIREYVEAWAEALRETADDPALVTDLLRVDQVLLGDGELERGVLVGPTHPLRIAWLLRYQQTLDNWVAAPAPSERETRELRGYLPLLVPANVPHVLLGEGEELRYLEPLDLYWALWTPPATPDASGLAANVRDRLGLPRSTVGGIRVEDVVQRIRRYLASHPYVDLLEINFVQPGLGDLVLHTLLALQSDPMTSELRYVLRLFSTELSREQLGRTLDEFMADPDAMKGLRRDAADAFLSSSDDPLTPKLIYSKHSVAELLEQPARFPAHLTVFMDWFDLDAVPVPSLPDRRSFFATGLLVDPVVVYRPAEGDMNPQWDEHVVADPQSPDWMIAAYGACEGATARLLGPRASGTVPAVRLELDKVRRTVLDAVHAVSDWVVVIDPVFTDDYLDSPAAAGETTRYLIDSTDPGALESTRRILVSTRTRAELNALLAPVLQQYGFQVPEDRVEVLLDALQALSAGLPLALLNNRTQALEALTLSLATLLLAARGVLRRGLVIPLDMHTDLVRETANSGESPADLRRTDLAVVQIDPHDRLLAVHLIEVKARGKLPPGHTARPGHRHQRATRQFGESAAQPTLLCRAARPPRVTGRGVDGPKTHQTARPLRRASSPLRVHRHSTGARHA